MIIINFLFLFPIIVSPFVEKNPKVIKRNSGYIIAYQREDEIYGADLNQDGNLLDTFKIALPHWNGYLEKPAIGKLQNDTFFVAYQYTPYQIPPPDGILESILGREIIYSDSVIIGDEHYIFIGGYVADTSWAAMLPFIKGGNNDFLLMFWSYYYEPSHFFPMGEHRWIKSNASNWVPFAIPYHSVDFKDYFYTFNFGEGGVFRKYDEYGNLIQEKIYSNLPQPDPNNYESPYTYLEEENNYLCVAYYNQDPLLTLNFFHTLDTFLNTLNTEFYGIFPFKLLSITSYFYLFVADHNLIIGKRFTLNGNPAGGGIVYHENSTVKSMDGIWDGSRFFIVYEKNNDIYGIFVDSLFSVNISEKTFKKDKKFNILFLKSKNYFSNKISPVYDITGKRIKYKLKFSGTYIVPRKNKIIIIK